LQKEKNDTRGNNFVLAKEPPTNIYDQSETRSEQTGKMELGRYEGRLTKNRNSSIAYPFQKRNASVKDFS